MLERLRIDLQLDKSEGILLYENLNVSVQFSVVWLVH